MKDIIFPASRNQITAVILGEKYIWPSIKNIEDIRNWILSNLDRGPTIFNEIPKIFGIKTEAIVYPAICDEDATEYVLWFSGVNGHGVEPDKAYYEDLKNISKESFDDNNLIVYLYGGVRLQRINKILVPFI